MLFFSSSERASSSKMSGTDDDAVHAADARFGSVEEGEGEEGSVSGE